ncbi:hypothetical protein L1887_00945 [Cichorium endivia]|nr:hypothetical protein L1887_00945 [Cichorium endivia]
MKNQKIKQGLGRFLPKIHGKGEISKGKIRSIGHMTLDYVLLSVCPSLLVNDTKYPYCLERNSIDMKNKIQ